MQLGKDFKKVLKQIEEEKGLSEETIISSLEAAMVSAYKKFKGGNQHIEVHIDIESGEISLYEVYEIVSEVVNADAEMTPEEAERRGYKDLEVGDVIRSEVLPEDFGRIAAQTARQVIIQKLKDAERQVVYEQFSDKIGNIVTGSIFKAEGDQILVRLNDKTEAIMPKEERIVGEKYNPGDRMKFYLLDVRQTTRGPRIIVSRTHPGLLRRLLELEVPEISDGVVEIRNIVREAGTRAKIAVASLDVNVETARRVRRKAGRTHQVHQQRAQRRKNRYNRLQQRPAQVHRERAIAREDSPHRAVARPGPLGNRLRSFRPAFARDRQGWAERPPRGAPHRMEDRHQGQGRGKAADDEGPLHGLLRDDVGGGQVRADG